MCGMSVRAFVTANGDDLQVYNIFRARVLRPSDLSRIVTYECKKVTIAIIMYNCQRMYNNTVLTTNFHFSGYKLFEVVPCLTEVGLYLLPVYEVGNTGECGCSNKHN